MARPFTRGSLRGLPLLRAPMCTIMIAKRQTMSIIRWNEEKNLRLKEERGVCFEDVVFKIGRGEVLDILEHPHQERYPGQRIFVVEIEGYAYLVPFVETEGEIFLKTVIPSRKATRRYLAGGRRGKDEEDEV